MTKNSSKKTQDGPSSMRKNSRYKASTSDVFFLNPRLLKTLLKKTQDGPTSMLKNSRYKASTSDVFFLNHR